MNNAFRIVLASASPRRQELIRRLGLTFSIQAAGIDEGSIGGDTPAEVTARIAAAKGDALHAPGQVTIAADTSVVIDGETLGKPGSPAEATEMLRRLRGRPHQVLTALAVCVDGKMHLDVVATDVCMRPYSDAEIAAYVASGDPMDKAGSYAVQSVEFHPVECIRGCYQNVIGLPLCQLCKRLLAAGVRVPILPPPICRVDLGQGCPVALFCEQAQGDGDFAMEQGW